MQAGYVLNSAQQPHITSEREQYLLMAYPHFAEDHQDRLPIEIAVFEATEQMEETIIRWMHRIISNKEQFTIQIAQQIDDATGRLQVRIADTTPFQQLATQLNVVSQYISSYQCKEIYFSVRPYLRSNQPCFAALFTITELVLMRKRYEQDDYRQVNVFGLKP
ncbi:MAG: hypothetical protein B7Y37_04005 [Sphingobacteriia bacterium 28-36-52]|jgi:hypothetical protein|nr:MAG: hypothetical protein B7Z27_00555 [Sphingobacteriia bacterium 32-37-4]OYZ02277.1 MAG: hypothetical protein B7Y37_04005 [Sphingobacteriia bacterium 28-36-52]